MANLAGFDAAFCPDPVPADLPVPFQPWTVPVEWCEFYMGGSSATRQDGWDDAEMGRVEHLPKLPVWVPTPGFENPRQSALGCLAALRRYGVPAFAEPYRMVMWDLETGREPDAAWLDVARSVMLGHGYDTMPYGSTSWIFGYQPYSGYMVADPTGRPHMYVHPGVAGTQYQWGVSVRGGVVDADLLDSAFLPHLHM